MSRMQTFRIFVVIGLFPCLLVGCGQSSPATVTGVITLDGQSLPEGPRIMGTVMYFPTGGGAAAYGSVTSSGSYSVQTGDTQGLRSGEYQVTVRVVDIDPPPPGASGYNAPPNSKPITPRRYQDRGQTDLKVQVEKGANEIDLQLSSSET